MKEFSPFDKKISAHDVYKAVNGYRKESGNIITFDLEIKGQIGLYVLDVHGKHEFVGRYPNWKAYIMINNLTEQVIRTKAAQQNFILPTGPRPVLFAI